MSETIYVITHHQNNHIRRNIPIDSRFLARDKNYVFYVVDDVMPQQLASYPYLLEKDIDPVLHGAGKHALAEWSFLWGLRWMYRPHDITFILSKGNANRRDTLLPG